MIGMLFFFGAITYVAGSIKHVIWMEDIDRWYSATPWYFSLLSLYFWPIYHMSRLGDSLLLLTAGEVAE